MSEVPTVVGHGQAGAGERADAFDLLAAAAGGIPASLGEGGLDLGLQQDIRLVQALQQGFPGDFQAWDRLQPVQTLLESDPGLHELCAPAQQLLDAAVCRWWWCPGLQFGLLMSEIAHQQAGVTGIGLGAPGFQQRSAVRQGPRPPSSTANFVSVGFS